MKPLTEKDQLNLSLYFQISPRMAEILAQLFNTVMVTYDELDAKSGKGHRHIIARLRPVVEKHGVAIETQHGRGYWIDNTSRVALLKALEKAYTMFEPKAAKAEGAAE